MDKPQATQTTTKPGQRVPETHPASAIRTETEGAQAEATIARSASQPRPVTGSAVVLTRHGGAEALEVRAWEVPPPGPREVRLRVEAAGVSFADLLFARASTRSGGGRRTCRAGMPLASSSRWVKTSRA
jgi:hypothetical protein